MRGKKGIILTLTIIFTLVMLIIATVSINLITNQAYITENQVGRVKAYYTAEAAMTKALEQLRGGVVPPCTAGILNLTLNNVTAYVCVASRGSTNYQCQSPFSNFTSTVACQQECCLKVNTTYF